MRGQGLQARGPSPTSTRVGRDGTFSTVAFGVTAVAAVVGTVLWVTSGDGTRPRDARGAQRRRTCASGPDSSGARFDPCPRCAASDGAAAAATASLLAAWGCNALTGSTGYHEVEAARADAGPRRHGGRRVRPRNRSPDASSKRAREASASPTPACCRPAAGASALFLRRRPRPRSPTTRARGKRRCRRPALAPDAGIDAATDAGADAAPEGGADGVVQPGPRGREFDRLRHRIDRARLVHRRGLERARLAR